LAAEQAVVEHLQSLAANPQAAALLLEIFPGSDPASDGSTSASGLAIDRPGETPTATTQLDAISALLGQLGRHDGLQAAGLALPISFLAAEVIGSAAAAYAVQAPDGHQRIYVNRDWLNQQSSSDAIAAVLLEELGHAIDQKLNPGKDSPGDEGQRFAAALLGLSLDADQRQRIATESDAARLRLDGATVQVEMANGNTAPLLTGASPTISVLEDAPSPTTATDGVPVSSLLGGMSDPDGSSPQGAAISNLATGQGSWFYKLAAGAWTVISSPPSTTAALLLPSDARLAFVASSANWNGSISNAITFRAWDQSFGAAAGLADITINGGETAFSATSASATLEVTPVNDAPIALGWASANALLPSSSTVVNLQGGASLRGWPAMAA
jgi:hypothetical protein